MLFFYFCTLMSNPMKKTLYYLLLCFFFTVPWGIHASVLGTWSHLLINIYTSICHMLEPMEPTSAFSPCNLTIFALPQKQCQQLIYRNVKVALSCLTRKETEHSFRRKRQYLQSLHALMFKLTNQPLNILIQDNQSGGLERIIMQS